MVISNYKKTTDSKTTIIIGDSRGMEELKDEVAKYEC